MAFLPLSLGVRPSASAVPAGSLVGSPRWVANHVLVDLLVSSPLGGRVFCGGLFDYGVQTGL